MAINMLILCSQSIRLSLYREKSIYTSSNPRTTNTAYLQGLTFSEDVCQDPATSQHQDINHFFTLMHPHICLQHFNYCPQRTTRQNSPRTNIHLTRSAHMKHWTPAGLRCSEFPQVDADGSTVTLHIVTSVPSLLPHQPFFLLQKDEALSVKRDV